MEHEIWEDSLFLVSRNDYIDRNSFHYVRIVATTSLPSSLAVTMREYKVLGTLPPLNFLIGHQENLRNGCEVCLIRDMACAVQKKQSKP